ncbi:MAG: hypothetical protein ACTH59_14450 [Pseudoalteromonas nigrifaciens]|uniref:hypothetical protein n=1 Tax=Pseudoalteromonas nigrifaciens TaxID=28109 RepID=UPI003F9C1732
MIKIIPLLLTLTLFGCSSVKNTETASSDDGKICKMEKTTGSNIATRICRTVEQIAYQKKIAKEALKEMTRGSIKSRK